MRPRSAEPQSGAPLLSGVGSYVAAASDARDRALLVAAARVRQQHEASLWRGASANKRSAVREQCNACCMLTGHRTQLSITRPLLRELLYAQRVGRADKRPPLGPRRVIPAAVGASAGQRPSLYIERQLQVADERAGKSDWLANIAAQEASLLASLDRLDGLLWRKRAAS